MGNQRVGRPGAFIAVEVRIRSSNTHFVTPDNIRQDLIKSASEWRSSNALPSSACVSPTLSPQTTTGGSTVSGDPSDSFLLDQNHKVFVDKKYQNIITMISSSTAV